MEQEITYSDLEQALKGIEDSLSNWRFYIEHGADNGSFCNERDNLRSNTDYFLNLINNFVNQLAFKSLKEYQFDDFPGEI